MATPTQQPVRSHVFHEITRSLCPECRQVVDAQVLIRDGAVYLRKRCLEHGWHEALVSSDADWHLKSLKYNKPGAIPYDFATTVEQGCPFDCGLCPEHQQHTCVGIIEITSRCNLGCPTCFADAGSGHDLSVAQVEAMLDRLLETEGRPEVVQISGGEPTLHPHLLDILAAAKARHIRHVMLNTNGLRLAQDPDFVRQLARYRPTIYLQFDGLTASTHQTLRGRDLRAIKKQALDNLAEAGLYAVLVATVAQGINEGEIGHILRYGLEHPVVLGVNYQPVTFAGRCLNHHDPLHRITLPDVLHALEAQTEGLFLVSDFRPVPCPHPTCSACTYAFLDGQQASPEPSRRASPEPGRRASPEPGRRASPEPGRRASPEPGRRASPEPGRRVIPIPRLLDVDNYLDFVTNRTMPDLSAELQPVLEALWSMAAVMGSDQTTDNLDCVACGIEVPLSFDPERLREHFLGIQVHGFMDEHTFDLKRLMKCCIHVLLPDGRAVPFCAYNNLGYRL